MKAARYARGIAPLVIVLVVGALLAVGGGTYYMTTKNKAEVKVAQDAISADKKTTLRDLLSLGNNLQCTFAKDIGGTNTKGTIYLYNTDLRGDFVTTVNGTTITSHMIKTSSNIYVWSDMQGNQGIKMAYTPEMEAQAKQDNAVSFDEELDYDCIGWNQDVSKFVIPSSINFIELNAMMQNKITPSGQATGSVQGSVKACAVCDQVNDPQAKAQCKQALSCN